MDLGLSGKRALVTGASHGIGYAVALALAREGCKVTVVARREAELRTTVDAMGGRGAGHQYDVQDLTLPGVPERVARRVPDCEIVVHSVGGTLGLRGVLSPSADWARVWHLNVGTAIDINNAVVPGMQRRGWGRIVHISSISAKLVRSSPLYATAKSALNTYTLTLGRAVAKDGVVVSAVMPGAIRVAGNHWDQSSPEDLEDFLRHHQVIGRLGVPEEIAAMVVFLCSQQASFATGCVVPLHGGTIA